MTKKKVKGKVRLRKDGFPYIQDAKLGDKYTNKKGETAILTTRRVYENKDRKSGPYHMEKYWKIIRNKYGVVRGSETEGRKGRKKPRELLADAFSSGDDSSLASFLERFRSRHPESDRSDYVGIPIMMGEPSGFSMPSIGRPSLPSRRTTNERRGSNSSSIRGSNGSSNRGSNGSSTRNSRNGYRANNDISRRLSEIQARLNALKFQKNTLERRRNSEYSRSQQANTTPSSFPGTQGRNQQSTQTPRSTLSSPRLSSPRSSSRPRPLRRSQSNSQLVRSRTPQRSTTQGSRITQGPTRRPIQRPSTLRRYSNSNVVRGPVSLHSRDISPEYFEGLASLHASGQLTESVDGLISLHNTGN